ncbi:MAG: MFS transporter [Gammaproteobacteria bacterium]|jgi:GPH family glycoside/pentoside/hexuronide:cation symporter
MLAKRVNSKCEGEISFYPLFQYAFLALPLGFSGFPIYILAPDFYALNYQITLSSLGIALLFIRMIDAFQDPLIGVISDRYRSHIFFIMCVSSFILTLSIYSLFNATLFTPLIRFVIFMTLSVSAYSILTINLNTVGGLWLRDETSQTKISAMREFFALIGLLIAVSAPTLFERLVQKNQVYTSFTFMLLVLIIFGLIGFYKWYAKYSKKLQVPIKPNIFKMNSLCSSTKKFYGIYLISMFASSIPAVLVIFFVRDLLGVGSYTGVFLILYFISAAIFIPFWNHTSQKVGKYRAWLMSMLLASLTFVWAFFLNKGDVWQYGVICFISGSALGGDLVFPPSIVAEQVHASKSQSYASSYYSILTLLSKASLAFASALSFFILDYAEFKVGGSNLRENLLGLSVAYALVPCLLKLISAFMLWKCFIKYQR